MYLVKDLIDKWAKTHSKSELARLMGTTPMRLYDWETGRRPMPESQFARMAEIIEGPRKAPHLLWNFVKAKTRETAEAFKQLALHANRTFLFLMAR